MRQFFHSASRGLRPNIRSTARRAYTQSRRSAQPELPPRPQTPPTSSSKATSPTLMFGFGFAASVAIWLGQNVMQKKMDGNDREPISILDGAHLRPAQYASLEDMKKAIAEIEVALSDTEDIISTDDDDLHAHGFSEWSSINVETLPVAVAYPRCTEQVSTIARICHKWKVPIIPYSGGSSVEGHTAAPFGGVSIDFVHMDKIIKVNEGDMDATVQPSVLWTDLNDQLARNGTGLFFPVDPAPNAKIGGMIGTNCSGTNAVRYGTMRDWVVNLTVVLADGTVFKTRRRPRKCSAGYNLNGIFVGSEGTLGIVTEATVKLAVIPQHTSVAVVPFNDIRTAVAAATSVIRGGIPVAAVELMDEVNMRIVNEAGATSRVWKEQPTLFFKFGGTEGMVDDNVKETQRILQQYGIKSKDFEFAIDAEQQKQLWSARKESLYSLLALRKDGEELWNTDVAVPLSRLADIVEASREEAASLGLKVSIKGHVGDGNFHENVTYDKTKPSDIEKATTVVKNMVKRALEMEGTCTGEHGIGYGKKAALEEEVGNTTLSVMRLFKGTLDPYWIMNPGKIFDR